MNRVPTVWVEAPEEDDPDDIDRSISFRLRDDWCAVDRDQLVLPITLLERDGTELEEPQPALLMQYGGEGLLNDLLMSDGNPEPGSTWLLQHTEGFGRNLTHIE
jgi:hypothetical protein